MSRGRAAAIGRWTLNVKRVGGHRLVGMAEYYFVTYRGLYYEDAADSLGLLLCSCGQPVLAQESGTVGREARHRLSR